MTFKTKHGGIYSYVFHAEHPENVTPLHIYLHWALKKNIFVCLVVFGPFLSTKQYIWLGIKGKELSVTGT